MDLLTDGGLLERLRDAAVRLAGECQGLLQAQEGARTATQLEHGGARLAGTAVELMQLLGALPLQQLQAATTRSATANRPSCSGAFAAAAASSSLLQLPDELLHRVGRLVGKECRTICSRLRDTYGPPALTITQPRPRVELEAAIDRAGGYLAAPQVFRQAVLLHLAEHYDTAAFAPADISSCCVRWPGWAAQVTRLELSDACQLTATTLQHIHDALPALRQLQCTWLADVPAADQAEPGLLPQLATLTQLSLLGSLLDVAYHQDNEDNQANPQQPLATFGLLGAAPNLRSLHLDLRFLLADAASLHSALQNLVHLTHLQLVCSSRLPRFHHSQLADTTAAEVVLSPLADRLQSLELRDGDSFFWSSLDPEPVMSSMVQLTRFACSAEYVHDNLLIHCAMVPRLHDLVLLANMAGGATDGMYSAEVQREYWNYTSVPAMPAVRTLAMPTFEATAGDLCDGSPKHCRFVVQCILSGVEDKCTGLTSLQVGFVLHPSCGAPVPEPGEMLWLLCVGRMQHLQRLVLTMDATDLPDLSCLSALPLLTELWLQLHNAQWLQGRLDADPGLDPAQALSHLGLLKHLAVRVNASGGCSGVVGELLAAALQLPRLEVLDASNLAVFSASAEAWLPLADSPPASLRELRLSCVCPESAVGGVQEHIHSLLSRRLAGSAVRLVVVPDSAGAWLVPSEPVCSQVSWGAA